MFALHNGLVSCGIRKQKTRRVAGQVGERVRSLATGIPLAFEFFPKLCMLMLALVE